MESPQKSSDDFKIGAELTPNPHTLKFNVNREFLSAGSRNFTDAERAKLSPLAAKLFELPQVSGVLIGTDFITVTKMPDVEWFHLVPQVIEKMKEFAQSGEPALSPEAEKETSLSGKSEIEQKIIEILDTEIRPAVARDGGDIIFYGYDDGIVKLHMQGACSSCPSSTMTLKLGIESRLKQMFPEIKEVLQV